MKKLLFLLLLVMLLPCSVPAEEPGNGGGMSGKEQMEKAESGQPDSLVWMVSDKKNGTIIYEVGQQDGKLLVERTKDRKKTEIFVHPVLYKDFVACVRECGLEGWTDFPKANKPGGPAACSVTLGFADDRESLTFRLGSLSALSDGQLARYKKAEKTFFAFVDAVLLRAEEAQKAQKSVPAVEEFFIVFSGMCSKESYEVYRRLDRQGFVSVARTATGHGSPYVREAVAGDAWMEDLASLLDKYNVPGWNGFKGQDQDVMDGDDFSMHVSCAGGKRVQASGYSKFPDGFGAFCKELDGLFDRLGISRHIDPM